MRYIQKILELFNSKRPAFRLVSDLHFLQRDQWGRGNSSVRYRPVRKRFERGHISVAAPRLNLEAADDRLNSMRGKIGPEHKPAGVDDLRDLGNHPLYMRG